MTEIRTSLPANKTRLLLAGREKPLVTLFALEGKDLKYSMSDKSKDLRVTDKGEVVFTERFFSRSLKETDDIKTFISVIDNIGVQDRTSLQVTLSSQFGQLDCDFIAQDLCYWQSAEYRVYENSSPETVLGSLASPYLAEMCTGFKINYKIIGNNNRDQDSEFHLVRSGSSWLIQTRKSLDRDTNNSTRAINVTCYVENPGGTIRDVQKTLRVNVLDVDDNPPTAQESEITVQMPSNVVLKGQAVQHADLIFHDRDSQKVNTYEATILGDNLNILRPHCSKHSNDYNRKEPWRTAVSCKLDITRNAEVHNKTYSVVLRLNDTTLVSGDGTVQVPIHLQFHKPPDKLKKPLVLYPHSTVKVFRTAAPLARITQPDPRKLPGTNNFTMRTSSRDANDIFNVTYTGGIVFVHSYIGLRKAPERLSLNISWFTKDNKREWDEVELRVVAEPSITCGDMSDNVWDWDWCANYGNPEVCLSADSCAISTGGVSVIKRDKPQRCMWRGDKNPGNESTHLYATCTPDDTTCPDGICDPLEELYDRICPQDCYRDIIIPSKTNEKTGRGIDIGSGVCTCGEVSCLCGAMKKNKKKNKHSNTSTTVNSTTPLTSNLDRHVGNLTASEKISGIELARCGTTCVLGIVAGALFLVGGVAIVVICWHLDRVNKAVRGKFSNEAHDMAAPLSDYVDRTIPDPISLSFDMTTSLADTAVLNIINKYASDPKWEFPRNQLIIEQTLGEGEFGRVLRAKAMNIAGQSGYTTVAVKTLKDDARETELNDLLSEFQLLKEVAHPNVIRLLGVCTSPGGPIYLIIEFAEHGSLRNYLRRSRHLKSETWRFPSSTGLEDGEIHYDEPNVSKVTPKEILSFAWQICKGMAYLSDIKLVHRDLAARNVLLAADRICKISDFGLTRDIYEDDAYFKRSKGRVPVKWMAPESLSDHVYTNRSDVWSFGILVWELVTLGATPYPGIAVQNLFHLLKQGYRMERPDNCSPTLYNIMRSCWHIDPEQRPSFQELSAMWEKMLSDEVDYLDLTNNAIHNRSYFCATFDDNFGKSESSNPLNYLSKSQSYVKCGTTDKFQDSSNIFNKEQDGNQNELNTQGYETPVKVVKRLETPTNDCPQYYTDMALGKAKI